MKISCDFDGVMVERYSIPRTGKFEDCPPSENAIEAIRFIRKQGHEVYLFTARPEKQWGRIRRWLKSNHLRMRITNIKELGTHMYIDDRAVRFTNWLDITKLFG